jgi:1,4-dihydroxy-6-naphthoate synthase
MQNLSIAISPCPNDTFIFEKLATTNLAHTHNLNFTFQYADIEELNTLAQNYGADVIKISFAQYFSIKDKYTLLPCGGAMGYGVGPLLVKKLGTNININSGSIAIPGKHTTANFLLSYLFPNSINKTPLLFSQIEDDVLNNKFDAGLLIHEGRFTYSAKGLELIADLGKLWQAQTNLPIPLGCIVVKKSLGTQVIQSITELIKASIPSLQNPISITPYIKQHAQEMDEQVMMQHIQLYVNEFSIDIGNKGFQVIDTMESIYKQIQ